MLSHGKQCRALVGHLCGWNIIVHFFKIWGQEKMNAFKNKILFDVW